MIASDAIISYEFPCTDNIGIGLFIIVIIAACTDIIGIGLLVIAIIAASCQEQAQECPHTK